MQQFQMFFKPFKIRVPPLNFHIQSRRIHSIANIRLTEQPALLFGESFDLNIDVFGQNWAWCGCNTVNCLGKDLVTAFVVVFEVFALFFCNNGRCSGIATLGRFLVEAVLDATARGLGLFLFWGLVLFAY
jgi:hypothetical protein